MTKTHAEFLEELKQELKTEIKGWRKYPMTFAERIIGNESVIEKIEQFQAEQKQQNER